MKEGIIVALLILVGLMALGRSAAPQAVIQDTSKPPIVRGAFAPGAADEAAAPKLQFCQPVAPANDRFADPGDPDEEIA